ncbi:MULTISPECIES: hypothetical protein [unclassified Prochlorococcus]|uniref:hypothetical protein n=1 Tax=unclassified Prochlorococcus TaxID=2627481 RepID=UPI0005337809|nr:MULTISPECIES: hypothetical protein [unclassified Prochlorococcus]KGG16149.1 hypothetical protein EV06_0859 [Prochlorococcus sp. MIT 0602]KGG17268.1 hypothetical protein EV07_0706 [Prochlorococcus sp. MIT 0603]
MKVIKTIGALLIAYFIVNFGFAYLAISTNSRYKDEIKEAIRFAFVTQKYSIESMKDLTSLLIKDARNRISESTKVPEEDLAK